jgi:hypothetical protein
MIDTMGGGEHRVFRKKSAGAECLAAIDNGDEGDDRASGGFLIADAVAADDARISILRARRDGLGAGAEREKTGECERARVTEHVFFLQRSADDEPRLLTELAMRTSVCGGMRNERAPFDGRRPDV